MTWIVAASQSSGQIAHVKVGELFRVKSHRPSFFDRNASNAVSASFAAFSACIRAT